MRRILVAVTVPATTLIAILPLYRAVVISTRPLDLEVAAWMGGVGR